MTQANCLFDNGLDYSYYVNMNLKLAFFDVDGTLIWRKNSEGITLKSASFNYALNTRFDLKNVNYLSILGKKLYGLTDRSILKMTLLELGYSESDYYENQAELFRIVDDYFERNRHSIKDFQYKPNPSAREFLDYLQKQNITMGLVTGNIRKHADWKLRGVGFNGYFTTGAFGEDGEDRVEIMSVALARNGDIPLSSVCHFGDSPLDLGAAAKLGIRCVALTDKGGGTHSEKELESAAYGLIINSWDEVGRISEYLN